MTKDDLEMIGRSALFGGIPAAELPGLLQCLHACAALYGKGAALLCAGAPAGPGGLILSGGAQVVYEDVLGNRSIVGEVSPGELFGESFAFVPGAALPVSVTALTDTRALLFDAPRILQACSRQCPAHRRLTENLVRILAEKNVQLNRKIRYLSKRTTREKLLGYLSDQARAAGGGAFTIPFNRQDLADYLCVERSAMCAQLGRLRREGGLEYYRSRFRFL